MKQELCISCIHLQISCVNLINLPSSRQNHQICSLVPSAQILQILSLIIQNPRCKNKLAPPSYRECLQRFPRILGSHAVAVYQCRLIYVVVSKFKILVEKIIVSDVSRQPSACVLSDLAHIHPAKPTTQQEREYFFYSQIWTMIPQPGQGNGFTARL